MMRRTFLTRAGSLVACAAANVLFTGTAGARIIPNPDPKAVVPSKLGKVRGAVADGVHIFRGVPYGAPTSGDARFLPPSPAQPWPGIRDTLDYGDRAPQKAVAADRIITGSTATRETSDLIPVWSTSQSEDCLNLNIWTPGVNDGGKRPVMVWLHPGGFEFGSANIAFSDGSNLARRGNVVVVSVNHRLGPLGFLHLSELTDGEFARAGNVGMLDIVLGLRWVRDNIAQFGGDPDTVMIFGESGGGRKVSTVLAMPGAKGLFHRATIESGPGIRFPSSAIQTKRTRYILAELGISPKDFRKLQSVPVKPILDAASVASAKVRRELPEGVPFYETYGFAPVLGPDLPHWPFDPGAPTVSADIPVMIGTNRQEMSLAYTKDRSFDQVSEAQLMKEAHNLVGGRASDLVAVYRQQSPGATRRDLLLLLAADHSHRMDSIKLAERKYAQHGAQVYMYRFDWEAPVLGGLIKAAHTYEIPHVFDNAQLCSGMTGGNSDAVALAAKMSSAWIAFARSGDPNTPLLPSWPAYDTARRATMIFNDTCAVENDPGRTERLAWQKLGSPDPMPSK